MPEPIDHMDHLIATATAPVRPDPAVEEDVLLRLEQEIARLESVAVLGPDATDELIEIVPGEQQPRWPEPRRFGPWLLAAASVVAVVVGLALGGGDESVRTDIADTRVLVVSSTTLTNDSADAVANANAACASVLPGLPEGVRETLSEFSPMEHRREWIDDLLAISNALQDPVADLSITQPELLATYASIELELSNADRQFEQGYQNSSRFSIPRITVEMDELLEQLVALGAPACDTWE